MKRAVGRVLQQYAALKSYCLSEGTRVVMHARLSVNHTILLNLNLDDDAPRFQRLHALFLKPMTEIHLLFYQSVLQHVSSKGRSLDPSLI